MIRELRKAQANKRKTVIEYMGEEEEHKKKLKRDEQLAEGRMKVFEQVWEGAEKVASRIKARLFEMLHEAWRPMEMQEKHISILVELDAEQDPVWVYLQSQHEWLALQFSEAFKRYEARMAELTIKEVDRNARVKKGIQASDLREFMHQNAKEPDVQRWEAVSGIVRALCEILQTRLGGFWRVAQAYTEDRFGKGVLIEERMQVCQQMLRKTVQTFTDMVSAVVGLPERKTGAQRKPQFPDESDCLISSHGLGRLVSRLEDCRIEMKKVHSEAEARLAWLERESRKHCVAALCEKWLEDARVFHIHEDWQADIQDPKVTGYTRLFQRFQRLAVSYVGKLLGKSQMVCYLY